MRWTGDVACMGENRSSYRVSVGKPSERGHWKDLGVDGRVILKLISMKLYGGHGLDCCGSG